VAVSAWRSVTNSLPLPTDELSWLRGHRRPDPDLDAAAFALAHPAVERHHQVMGVAAGIDWPADNGYPQLDAEMFEEWECQAELVAVGGALWLADDHRGKPAVGLRSSASSSAASGRRFHGSDRDRPMSEELVQDVAAHRVDEYLGPGNRCQLREASGARLFWDRPP
jgi:hypothetical protein